MTPRPSTRTLPAPVPAPAGSLGSEADAETGDHLVARRALLVIRVAIFRLHERVAAHRMLDTGTDADTIQILMQVEAGRAAGDAGIIRVDARVGVAGLGVDQGRRRDATADAAAHVQITTGLC